MSQSPHAFTGRRRRRTTTWSVRLKDIIAQSVITLGGLGTIAAVLGVCVFLFWVVIPLFMPARVGEARELNLSETDPQTIIAQGIDEYQLMTWLLDRNGTLHAYALEDGALLAQQRVISNATITAIAQSDSGNDWLMGLSNGSVVRGQLGVSSRLVDITALPEDYRTQQPGRVSRWSSDNEVGLIQRVNQDQFRILTIESKLDEPLSLADGQPIDHLDFTVAGRTTIMAAMTGDGRLLLEHVSQRRNILTGRVTQTKQEWPIDFDAASQGRPHWLRLSGQGDALYLAWRDGRILRYDIRNPAQPVLAEELDLVAEPDEQLAALTMLLGRGTLITGDSLGRVRGWFRTRSGEAATPDGVTLTLAHELSKLDSAVVTLARSSRSRIIAAGTADGRVRLVQVTSGKQLADLKPEKNSRAAVASMVIGAKDDALLIFRENRMQLRTLDVGHPETTLSSLFLPVWYENYNQPQATWQSSGATDDFESKYGLWPLVFGSIKATVYSLLFGVPLALLAAVFTSEFLKPRTKAVIKPTIEMMASLPSVVLGFLGALVIAPVAEQGVPIILTSFITIPLAFLTGALLWQLLPEVWTLRLRPGRLFFIAMLLPAGIAAAWLLGPKLEAVLFANQPMLVMKSWLTGAPVTPGDLKAWLDGQMGSGAAGWLILLLPVSLLAVAMASTRLIQPLLRSALSQCSRRSLAVITIVRFFAGGIATVMLAGAAGLLLTYVLGWDPRGNLVGTYVQRNALIVGFVMGFAIIPIIYTIAEDALSAVPEHLRAASLGAGATPWQTAVRIVIPTAMSGLFSAVMIGVGRAVGETMIVLMAAGNTAITQWNPFNGFRTLSANIAVELPEAVENSTHYRTLYLAALVLFVITFLLNTFAETIRLRFRRRAYQL